MKHTIATIDYNINWSRPDYCNNVPATQIAEQKQNQNTGIPVS